MPPSNTPEADMCSPAYYKPGALVAASPSMLRYVCERVVAEQATNAAFIVDTSIGIGDLGVVRGLKFEPLVLAAIKDGVDLECRRLLKRRKGKQAASVASAADGDSSGNNGADSGSVDDAVSGDDANSGSVDDADSGSVDDADSGSADGADTAAVLRRFIMPPTPRVSWSSLDHLKQCRGIPSLLVPEAGNVAGLDALAWIDSDGHHSPLDTTVSASHGIHAQGFYEAVTRLGWTYEKGWPPKKAGAPASKFIKYFWLIPADRYTAWTRSQKMKKDSATTRAAVQAFKRLQQFVVRVPPITTVKAVADTLRADGVKLPGELVAALK